MLESPVLRNGKYHLNGTSYPRVSDILATLAKPGLDKWKRRVGFQEADRVSREATDLGTRIHAACEAWWRQDGGSIADDVEPFVDAYARWYRASVREVFAAEHTVVHTAHGYAGTLDLYAEMRDGRRMVWDIKSSNSISPEYRLQLSAYGAALEEAGERVDGRGIVNLPSREPGTLRVIEYDDDDRDRRAWIALVRLYKWQERHADDWKAYR